MAGVFSFTAGSLAVDALFVEDDLIPGAWWALFILAAVSGLYWIVTSKPIAPRLPSLRFDIAGPGFSVHVLPPEKSDAARRLRRKTDDLVGEIHSYLQTVPGYGPSLQRHHGVFDKMQAADSEEEKSEIWHQYTQEEMKASEVERRELVARFGGRVEFLLTEYGRRGLLSESRSILLWKLGNNHWLGELATNLEATKLQL